MLRSLRTPLSKLARGYATVSDVAGGVKVAGIDLGQPTTSLTVVVKAGSRFESQPGVAHVLKNFAFKATAHGSALKTVRETELYGGVLSSALSREHLFLTAEFLRGDDVSVENQSRDHFLSLLSDVLSSSKYTPHEYSELVLPSIASDSLSASADPTTLAFDLAHQLAFRKGLGNSLFASATSPVSSEAVKAYAEQAFAKSNIAVVGSGISTEKLSSAVAKAFGSGSAGSSTLSSSATQYFGGETRVPLDPHASGSARPTLIIAYGSTSAASPELSVLSHVLGGTSGLKWSPGASPLSIAADKFPGSSAKAFVLPYTDAALFGVVVTAPTSEGVKNLALEIGGLIKAAGKDIKEDELKRAVAKAKFEAAAATESKEGIVAVAGPQLLAGSVQSLEDAFSSFGKVSTSSLSKAASELFKGKPTVVAVGDLHVLPYADELKL